MQNKDSMTWQYIAGFFDGEGHTRIQNNSGTMRGIVARAQISQAGKTGEVVLNRILNFLQQRDIKSHLSSRKKQPVGRPQQYNLVLTNRRNVIPFLRGMFPYLIVKKAVSQDILRFLSIFPIMPRKRVMMLSWETRRHRDRCACKVEPSKVN